MKKITFFFRDGGIIVSKITNENNTLGSMGQRMCAGGFITSKDNYWGKDREIVINLSDVKMVIIENE